MSRSRARDHQALQAGALSRSVATTTAASCHQSHACLKKDQQGRKQGLKSPGILKKCQTHFLHGLSDQAADGEVEEEQIVHQRSPLFQAHLQLNCWIVFSVDHLTMQIMKKIAMLVQEQMIHQVIMVLSQL